MKNDNLKLIKQGLKIEALDGKRYIYGKKDVFNNYIDSDFKNWKLDKKSNPTQETKVDVYELIKNATFKEMFVGNLDKLCLTQDQIIEFCDKHPDWLNQEEGYTFFLFKVNKEYFVARVDVDSDGLIVHVDRFERDYLWLDEYCHRLVVPQLDDKKQRKLYFSNLKNYYPANKKRELKAMKMIAAHELRLRNEGRDYFKKELLLDIERMEMKGYENSTIIESIKNHLRFN